MLLLNCLTFLLILPLFFVAADDHFRVPTPNIQVFHQGLKISVPASTGIKLFTFYGKIESATKDPVTFTANGALKGDYIVYENKNTKLNIGDTIKYRIFVRKGSLGYFKDKLTYTVSQYLPEDAPIEGTEDIEECVGDSITYVNNVKKCKGQLLFDEAFTSEEINRRTWVIESRIPDDIQETEFVSFQPSAVSIDSDYLKITPSLLSDHPSFNQDSILDGTLDFGANCTSSKWDLCRKESLGAYILPPVISGKMRSTFTFKYGKIEIRAKLPQGDWIFPELYLETGDDSFNTRGVIKIAFARGNLNLRYQDEDIGNKLLSGGITLQNQNCRVKSFINNNDKAKNWGDAFHTFRLIWQPNSISFDVDDKPYGRINLNEIYCDRTNALPDSSLLQLKEKEFHIALGVGVAGNFEFPNNIMGKKWRNHGTKCLFDFWNDRENWFPTWNDKSSLIVHTVKVWAL